MWNHHVYYREVTCSQGTTILGANPKVRICPGWGSYRIVCFQVKFRHGGHDPGSEPSAALDPNEERY